MVELKDIVNIDIYPIDQQNCDEYKKLVGEDLDIRRSILSSYPDAAIANIYIERGSSEINVTVHTARPGIIIGRGGQKIDEMRKILWNPNHQRYVQATLVSITLTAWEHSTMISKIKDKGIFQKPVLLLIAISIPVTPLNLAVNPPFVNILPDCPSDLLASWRNRAGLCYDPGS